MMMGLSSRVLVVVTSLVVMMSVLSDAATVQLASCPSEPEVVGEYYNNGELCVRERIVLQREIETADCPEEYKYLNGWCRRRFHRKIKPTCFQKGDGNWQLFLGTKGECHSTCPKNYASSYGQCELRRMTLAPKYMTCPPTDRDGNPQHRYGAYCCSHELGNCPKPECKVGEGVPGKFYYNADEQTCERQAQAIARVTMPRITSRLGTEAAARKKGKGVCPKGKIPVRNACQDPCPDKFKTLKGKCELRSCKFDTQKDVIVRCPEGTYKLPRAVI
ncbi:expressed unknown protein [Seminavis robusta]|uniref:Uncharacterized protein n=1 Tax=Seminavis robusta TaxID=568900 RepID=A0A9N8EH53_9STRA|nr:expressed unknown protein [Seminavis robusta]|eukprot:Sro1072_g238100.1 n/a (275) ;mRNA; f:24413-25237